MTEQKISSTLAAAGFENAVLEARLLCEYFSGEALQRALERRLSHEPLQYILGEWGFFRETYEVNEHCLVPRPDTELLVEKAIALLPHGAHFLDLCTGSGCIAISTLAARKDTTATMVDLFPETLALAERNAHKNGVAERVIPQLADVLQSPSPTIFPQHRFTAILSNPPYIRSDILKDLQPEVQKEPQAALDGGTDGLEFYRALLEKWSNCLTPMGFFLFEIGYDQKNDITALAETHGFSCTVYKDLGGNDRVAHIFRTVS